MKSLPPFPAPFPFSQAIFFISFLCNLPGEFYAYTNHSRAYSPPIFKANHSILYTLLCTLLFFHSTIYLGKFSIWVYKEHLDLFLQLQKFPLHAWKDDLFSWCSHDGHLDSFQYFAIINEAATNNCIHMYFHVFVTIYVG